ncbi:MAG: CAP domain-containing protein [bacterium]
MSIFRGLLILIVFFLGIYILRDPSSSTGSTIQSGYVNPFVQFFRDIKSSSTNLPGFLKNDNPQLFNMFGYGGVDTTVHLPTATSSASGAYKGVSTSTKKIATVVDTTKTDTTKNTIDSKIKNTVVVSQSGDSNVELSPDGIIQYTNIERLKGGLKPIAINDRLSRSASNKLQDIFEKQYFEHISPSGVGVSDLAKQAGYDYVVVGENLALGSFGSNQALLAAWMASPGHRANIMDPRYQDIGVAVGRGMFQGSLQWVAIQHFGKPLAACVHLDPSLKTTIDANKAYLVTLEAKINALKTQLETLSGAAYREKAEEYNDSVKDYNVRLMSLQSDVTKYNKMAEEFNACIGTNPNSAKE